MTEKSWASTTSPSVQPLPGGKYEQDIYWRRPNGWITTGPSRNGTCVNDFISRGFEPLWKYGHLPSDSAHWEDSPWTTILEHPTGPGEFPVDQLLTAKWYLAEECPVPGVVFPQLKGHTVKEYPCPEVDCERKFFDFDDEGRGPPRLASHLKIIHGWNQQAIIMFAEKLGLNFDEIYRGVGHAVSIDVGAEATPEVTHNCPDCDWRPRPDAKKPDVALRMHTKAAHPALVVEVASS